MGLNTPALDCLVEDLAQSVREAATLALGAFVPGARTSAEIFWKAGGSPVTAMDLAVDEIIHAKIVSLNAAGHPAGPLHLHSEERPESWSGDPGGTVVVLDPIDGTRSFMAGYDDWCISLGLLRSGQPVGGIVNAPARSEFYVATLGSGARLNGLPVRLDPSHFPLRATGPKGWAEATFSRLSRPFIAAAPVAALAYRMVRPLSGEFDLAIARPGSHDWDLVAADCILREAGGALVTSEQQPATYTLRGEAQPALFGGAREVLSQLLLV
ncbi:SuhB Archaeal fructose-1,6-bisphosphatase and related enzymes of inositol monophosphatase family [Rhabdaerophilaceae bacterium]